jgi:mxaL protein
LRARGAIARLRDAIDARILCLLLAAAFAIVALTHPSLQLERPVHRYLFVVDVTESMNVPDAGPPDAPSTRIAFAKRALTRVVSEMRCGSEVGLALFAEHRALTLWAPVEVCANFDEITSMLATIDWRLAWRGGSQIARGLDSALSAARALGPDTRLVFVSDGHEAPPVDAKLRLHLERSSVTGVIVGVGGDDLSPIPVLDDEGKLTGYWAADQVPQVDGHSLGRPGSESSETMVGVDRGDVAARIAGGTEHLSSLREEYLRELAREAGLDYRRAVNVEDIRDALSAPKLAHEQRVTTDWRWMLALASLACLLAALATPPQLPRPHAHFSRF